ncbi:MAG: ORF6N domain-containing protein, partial [Candidatus Binatota bacterium]
MFSTHLAELYEVEPRALVQAVKRNIERFPPDFMFQLSKAEFKEPVENPCFQAGQKGPK